MDYSEKRLLALASGTRRVLTPEGVRKYGEPIGAIINPDGLSQADKLGAEAAPGKRGASGKRGLRALKGGSRATMRQQGSASDAEKAAALRQAADSLKADEAERKKKASKVGSKAPLAGVGKETDSRIMAKFADAVRKGSSVPDAYDKTIAWVHTRLASTDGPASAKNYVSGFKAEHMKAVIDREAVNFGGKEFADRLRREAADAKKPSLNPSDRYLATKKFVQTFAQAMRETDFPAPQDPWSIPKAKLLSKMEGRLAQSDIKNVDVSVKLLEAVRRAMLDYA